jgi:formylglycine-generating enzyme required for sulfatase activity
MALIASAQVAKPDSELEITNSLGMKLRRIPSGKITVKITDEDILNRPASDTIEIEIPKPFYMGIYEVTQAEFARVMGTNPCSFHPKGDNWHRVVGQDTSRFPAENITWSQAQAFCEKLSNLPEEKAAGRRYRLPSGDEWEYAARAGSSKQVLFAFGSSLSAEQANFDAAAPLGEKSKGPHLRRPTTVGSYKPNAWGLYDLHGNVWEWTSDILSFKDKEGKPLDRRMLRGGSWLNRARDCAASTRLILEPEAEFNNIGFRVVCEIKK